MLSFLEFAEEDCLGHVYVFLPCHLGSLAQLNLKQNGFCAVQAD